MTKYDEKIDIAKAREHQVVKHNILIQSSRYSLSLQEQKILLYVVSKIKPGDEVLKEYDFEITEFCKGCGIDYDSGGNYIHIKKSVQDMRNKSFWIELNEDEEVLCSWVNKARINKKSGRIKIRLDDDLHQYLIGLKENFTVYQLLSILPMKSQYSIRIYEILRSFAWKKREVCFDLGQLKKKLMAENYVNFKDFRRFVIEQAVRDINKFTDLEVDWEPLKKGNKVIQIIFRMEVREGWDKLLADQRAVDDLLGTAEQIEGQMSIYEIGE